MARMVLDSKIAAVEAANPRPEMVVTGNPGCIMQIGAGLLRHGSPITAVHPIELLHQAYRL
jgi:glycolate oxidase iron-sulfur subunit